MGSGPISFGGVPPPPPKSSRKSQEENPIIIDKTAVEMNIVFLFSCFLGYTPKQQIRIYLNVKQAYYTTIIIALKNRKNTIQILFARFFQRSIHPIRSYFLIGYRSRG